MVVMKCFSLRGNEVREGIEMPGGRMLFSDFGNEQLVAVGLDQTQHVYYACAVGKDINGTVVLKPFSADAITDNSRCLVLVHTYSPGCGAKRWPSFSVDWDHAGEVTILSGAGRSKGSGSDSWTLIIAPMDWPQNIASQFINSRDYPDQTIGYKPAGYVKPELDSLALAFNGDMERANQFRQKVQQLPTARLNEHILHNCGRARREAHLKEVSGDPDFFLGSDPNSVSDYIVDVHFPKGIDSRQSTSSLADAFKKAGFSRK